MRTPSFPERLMKYGVICRQNFLDDLLNWRFLYVAGRLHKPVRIMKLAANEDDAEINSSMMTNRLNAMRAALLLLPDQFTDLELYMVIASLSYMGDPRMGIGENPKKVCIS
jgi:translocator assembly and maintenance protein 41